MTMVIHTVTTKHTAFISKATLLKIRSVQSHSAKKTTAAHYVSKEIKTCATTVHSH